MNGFRNNGNPALGIPLESHLGGGLAVLFADGTQDRVELLQTVSDVRLSELSDITKETKNILEKYIVVSKIKVYPKFRRNYHGQKKDYLCI